MELQFKTFHLTEFKAAADGNTFEGYASTFGNADRVGDVMEPGCFKENLPDFLTDGFLAIGHDWGDLPAGYFTEAYEDAKGLYVKGCFHSTPEAQAARKVVMERLAAGKSAGLSIGFKTLAALPVYEDRPYGPRKYTKVKVYEVSLVTVPCNDQAGLTRAKGDRSDAATAPMDIPAALRALLDQVKDQGEDAAKVLAAEFLTLAGVTTTEPTTEPGSDTSASKAAPVGTPSPETRSERSSGRELATALVRAIETDYYVGSLLTTN